MIFPRAWARQPGPADFISVVVEDLVDRNIVLAGLPEEALDGIAVEVAEAAKRKHLGQWSAVNSTEAFTHTPREYIARRTDGRNESNLVVWVSATDDKTTQAWTEYATQFAGSNGAPRLCVAMAMSQAQEYREEKGLRRRLWNDFVTATDGRVLTERYCRNRGRSPIHVAFKGALVAELAGPDLPRAELLAREPLGRILAAKNYPPERIWAAQVSVLLPLVESERRRLLALHKKHWRLPHTRKDGKIIECLENLEIGDMGMQARQFRALETEQWRLDWLRRVRNALAHNEIVPWGTLVSSIALQIVDFRE